MTEKPSIWQRIKAIFSAKPKPPAEGLTKVMLQNGRMALVDKKGNFKGFV
jgi:hypothetical protein